MAGPLPYHRRYHSDILNAYVGMPMELRGAYDTILELLYERMRPLPNDPKWLARWLECSTRKAQAVVETLISRGKLYLTAEGTISNKRFELEAKDREDWSKTSSNSAAKRWRKYHEQQAVNNENKDLEVKSQSDANATNLNYNYNSNLIEGQLPFGSAPPPTTNGHKVKVSRKTRLDKDWQPTSEDLQVGIELGLSQKKITDEFEKFQDHASATGRAMVNWGSAFRMWLRKAAEYDQGKTQRL